MELTEPQSWGERPQKAIVSVSSSLSKAKTAVCSMFQAHFSGGLEHEWMIFP
jgi:hypothetical protein